MCALLFMGLCPAILRWCLQDIQVRNYFFHIEFVSDTLSKAKGLVNQISSCSRVTDSPCDDTRVIGNGLAPAFQVLQIVLADAALNTSSG